MPSGLGDLRGARRGNRSVGTKLLAGAVDIDVGKGETKKAVVVVALPDSAPIS